MGPLGLKPWEFWELTWDDYYRMVQGWHHNRELSWEESRFIGTLIYNANAKKSIKPQQLVPLNLDKNQKSNTSITTRADVDRILAKYENRKPIANGK